MKALVWTLAVAAALITPLRAGEMERIMEKGELVVSLNTGYPPFCIVEGDTVSGLDADLARLIADHLGVKVSFVLPDQFKEHIPRLLAGETDLIIAAMTRTVERGLQVNFTDPYYHVSQAALVDRDMVAPDATSYFDLVDIPNVRIGVKQDTTIERFARELFPEDAIRAYVDHPEAVAALLEGEVDATVHDSPFVRVWAATHPQHERRVKPLLQPVTKENYGFAVRKGDPDFLTWLNLFIAQVENNGTLELLRHRYFVEMRWAGVKPTREARITRAQLLRNKFVAERERRLEQRRREQRLEEGDAYH